MVVKVSLWCVRSAVWQHGAGGRGSGGEAQALAGHDAALCGLEPHRPHPCRLP